MRSDEIKYATAFDKDVMVKITNAGGAGGYSMPEA